MTLRLPLLLISITSLSSCSSWIQKIQRDLIENPEKEYYGVNQSEEQAENKKSLTIDSDDFSEVGQMQEVQEPLVNLPSSIQEQIDLWIQTYQQTQGFSAEHPQSLPMLKVFKSSLVGQVRVRALYILAEHMRTSGRQEEADSYYLMIVNEHVFSSYAASSLSHLSPKHSEVKSLLDSHFRGW